MRRIEILSLNWRDVNFAKSFILIENSKNGKARKVPMNDFVYRTLKEIPRLSSEHVFFNPETNDHVKDVKTAFHAACRRAEIKGLRLHDLRHTAASWMIAAGADLVTVKEILGHSSILMTMRYAHATPENKRLAVEKLGPILDPTRQKVDNTPEAVIEIRAVSPLNLTH
jgi:integrase